MGEEARTEGREALARADWPAARVFFDAELARDAEDADALDGLGEALWWIGEWARARELREKAYARYRTLGRRIEAARAAIWLANEYYVSQLNRAAWNGWLERASGLLEETDAGSERGWVVISRARRADD